MAEATDVTFRTGVWIGSILVLVGVIAYVLSDFASVTALIPSLFGLLFVFLGRLGLDAGRRTVALYGLAVVALLALVGSIQGVSDVVTLATGGSVDRPVAAVTQTVMVLLSIVVLVLVGRSFSESR